MPPRIAKPGALLEPDEVYGRDELIASLWKTLSQQSVRLEAEKRIGKSSILQKMSKAPPQGWIAVSLTLLNVHSAEEFAEGIVAALRPHQVRMQRLLGKVNDFFRSIGGVEVGGILKVPDNQQRPPNYWKRLLQATVESIVEATGEHRIVFFFDEVTLMLQNIARRQGESTAMEVLDVLSHLRKDYLTGQAFRMVLTGSIGMPHVLAGLKQKGHADQGVSAMLLVEVPPLRDDDAARLARDLIDGEAIQATDPNKAAKDIAQAAGNIPFYIHWIVRTLKTSGVPATVEGVDRTVLGLLAAPLDPLELRHYRTRLDLYYGDDVLTVLSLLDHVAAQESVHWKELTQLASAESQDEKGTTERVRELLRLLVLDHYLVQDDQKRYSFRYPLVRRWWRSDRDV